MDNHFFYQLAEKYVDGTATPEELALVEAFYEQLSSEGTGISPEMRQRVKAAMDQHIHAAVSGDQAPVPVHRIWPRVAAAAAILTAVATGSVLLLHRNSSNELAATVRVKSAPADIAPGGNKAILTLAGGSTIILDSAQNGTLASQGNARITKLSNGRLAYNIVMRKPDTKPADVVYNTLSTPRGGQYQLALPDGTSVWLNAASSITYPTAFTGREREVAITGEVYFEVAHNEKQSFTVSANGVEVRDIGTHFNINAYTDENGVKTTLLEGSVRVTATKTKESVIISPGQQADLNTGQLSLIKKVNLEEIIAWKEGSFHFESADLKTILRQFARWYDIDIVYEGTPGNRKFFGIVKRSNSLKRVLEMLKDNNIEYRIEGNKLIVKSS